MCCWHHIKEVFVDGHRWEKRPAQHRETAERTKLARVDDGFQDFLITPGFNGLTTCDFIK